MMVLAAAAVAFFALPLAALLWRVSWTQLPVLLTRPVVMDALALSLVVSLAATALAAAFGGPLAWVLARTDFPGKRWVRGIALLPMVLPPVVGGAALLFAFGRRGLVGGPLSDMGGIVLPFSAWGAVVAAAFVAMPFFVLTMEAAFAGVDRRYEAAAATLGAGPWSVLGRVTVPLTAPAIGAGLAVTWARAFGEFGATLTFAGNLPGRTQTLPLAVFVALESDRDAAVALSLVMVTVSFLVMAILRDRWWRPR